jgi:putative ABC transport system permease protein
MNSLLTAIFYALYNIRVNLFHTVLSVLGLIIGVSALLTMISMIDGLEKFAQDQIHQTTSIKLIEISSKKNIIVNGITIRKDQVLILSDEIYNEMIEAVDIPVLHFRVSQMGKEILYGTDIIKNKIGATVYYTDPGYSKKYSLEHGINLRESYPEDQKRLAVVNIEFAELFSVNDNSLQEIIGQSVTIDDDSYEISGVVSGPAKKPEILIPIHFLQDEIINEYPPFIIFEAEKVEDVPIIKKSLEAWLERSVFGPDDISISSQDFRVEQATRGFMVFRLVMGLIIGISIVVGGIGVMNVLLISVTQRTNEIGIRKAVGSQKKDIYIQFLTESSIISLFGTLTGIIFGILFTLGVTPVVQNLTEINFQPVFTLSSIFIITAVSILIGILFGTFPAYKASQLDPIEALRRE